MQTINDKTHNSSATYLIMLVTSKISDAKLLLKFYHPYKVVKVQKISIAINCIVLLIFKFLILYKNNMDFKPYFIHIFQMILGTWL